MGMMGAAGAVPALGGSRAPAGKKPYNVVVIYTDEHNFRTLGCYRRALAEREALMWGSPVVETPYIDSIADRGVTADSFYVASPICGPSRATWITGLYPMDTGVIENDVRIRQELETFAHALQRAGYATGYSGKWHLDGLKDEIVANMSKQSGEQAENIYSFPEHFNGWVPPERGMGFEDNRFMFDTGHWKKFVSCPDGGDPTVFHPRIVGDETTFATDWLADRTVEFIEENKDRPFCYMLSLPDPHGPDFVREPYRSMYQDEVFEEPYTADKERGPAWAQMQDPHPGDHHDIYFGMVKCIDDNVGKILRKLDELGLTENTIVVFTADHGDMRREHSRRKKGIPYEASVKVPFVMMAPGLIPEGIRTGVALNSVDFKPTLLNMLGVSARQPSQGQDATAVLRGEPAPAGWNDLIFSRSPAIRQGTGWLMVADGRYKLVASPIEPLWLIDLEKDPGELVNRADDPELKPRLARMARALLEYAQTYDDPNLGLGNGRLRASLEAAL